MSNENGIKDILGRMFSSNPNASENNAQGASTGIRDEMGEWFGSGDSSNAGQNNDRVNAFVDRQINRLKIDVTKKVVNSKLGNKFGKMHTFSNEGSYLLKDNETGSYRQICIEDTARPKVLYRGEEVMSTNIIYNYLEWDLETGKLEKKEGTKSFTELPLEGRDAIENITLVKNMTVEGRQQGSRAPFDMIISEGVVDIQIMDHEKFHRAVHEQGEITTILRQEAINKFHEIQPVYSSDDQLLPDLPSQDEIEVILGGWNSGLENTLGFKYKFVVENIDWTEDSERSRNEARTAEIRKRLADQMKTAGHSDDVIAMTMLGNNSGVNINRNRGSNNNPQN